MKIKICGITTADDARFCAESGVDFVGLVFVSGSPRFVVVDAAKRLVETVRKHSSSTRVVGVFRDAAVEVMNRTAATAGLDLLQLHGSETPEAVAALSLPVIKAFRIGGRPSPAARDASLATLARNDIARHQRPLSFRAAARNRTAMNTCDYRAAAWFLFDTFHESVAGGTGKRFDWSLLPRRRERPFFLAGGLAPENIEEAIERVRPDGIDISSGVESAPGRKSRALIARLLEKVRAL